MILPFAFLETFSLASSEPELFQQHNEATIRKIVENKSAKRTDYNKVRWCRRDGLSLAVSLMR